MSKARKPRQRWLLLAVAGVVLAIVVWALFQRHPADPPVMANSGMPLRFDEWPIPAPYKLDRAFPLGDTPGLALSVSQDADENLIPRPTLIVVPDQSATLRVERQLVGPGPHNPLYFTSHGRVIGSGFTGLQPSGAWAKISDEFLVDEAQLQKLYSTPQWPPTSKHWVRALDVTVEPDPDQWHVSMSYLDRLQVEALPSGESLIIADLYEDRNLRLTFVKRSLVKSSLAAMGEEHEEAMSGARVSELQLLPDVSALGRTWTIDGPAWIAIQASGEVWTFQYSTYRFETRPDLAHLGQAFVQQDATIKSIVLSGRCLAMQHEENITIVGLDDQPLIIGPTSPGEVDDSAARFDLDGPMTNVTLCPLGVHSIAICDLLGNRVILVDLAPRP